MTEKSVIFYKSYYEALESTLETAEEKYQVIQALVRYAFNHEQPDYSKLSKPQRAIVIMALPLIDSTAKKRAGGVKGGRPKNQTGAKKMPLSEAEQSSPIYIPPDIEKRLQMKNTLDTLR